LSELFAEWGITLLDIAKKYTPITENKDPGLSVYTKDDLLKMSNELIHSVILSKERENVSKGINEILNYVMDGTIDSNKIPQKGGGGVGPNGKTSTNQESKGGESESKGGESGLGEGIVSLQPAIVQQVLEYTEQTGGMLRFSEQNAVSSNSSSSSCLSVLHRGMISATSALGSICYAAVTPNDPSTNNKTAEMRDMAKLYGTMGTCCTVAEVVVGGLGFVCSGPILPAVGTALGVVKLMCHVTSACVYTDIILTKIENGDLNKSALEVMKNSNVRNMTTTVLGIKDIGAIIIPINLPMISTATIITSIMKIRSYLSTAGSVMKISKILGSQRQPWNISDYNNSNNNNNPNNKKRKRKTRKYRSRM
jgi:hypothetical protein